jgi:spore maturation protein SpmB
MKPSRSPAKRAPSEPSILGRALPRAGRTIALLLKLILPTSLVVGLLRWSGALVVIGRLLSPALGIFRLPGEAAVALVSAWLGGIYALVGAMAVMPLDPAEITVLCAMALVAHNLIVECTVQDRSGTPWWWMLPVRLLSSALVGLVVAWSIAGLQWLHAPALWLRFIPTSRHTLVPESGTFSDFLIGWSGEASRLAIKLILIVTAMMIATEWIRGSGVMRRLEQACRPVLRFMGLSDSVAYLWLTGQILGVAYGAGLLIEELRQRPHYDARDVRGLHTSLGINHSVFEDTVLLAAVGASLFWITVPRILCAALVVRSIHPLPLGLRRRTGREIDGSRGAAPTG